MAASSWVDVINGALIELGSAQIFSLSDTSKQARLGVQRFPFSRDEVLRMKPWKSAAARIQLPQLSQTPAFGFQYAYQLPIDYIRMIRAHPDIMFYKIQGRTLLCNVTPAQIIYVSSPQSPVNLDPLLTETISMNLARKIGFSLVQEPSIVGEMDKKFQFAYRQAKVADSMEDTADVWEAVELQNSRLLRVGYNGVAQINSQYNF
jgi:hypothetical protein